MIADAVPDIAQARRLGHTSTPTSPPKSNTASSTDSKTAGTKH
jgi:hypothetical protein